MEIIELFYDLYASNKVEAWSKELGTRLSGISSIGNFRIKVNYSLLCLIGKQNKYFSNRILCSVKPVEYFFET